MVDAHQAKRLTNRPVPAEVTWMLFQGDGSPSSPLQPFVAQLFSDLTFSTHVGIKKSFQQESRLQSDTVLPGIPLSFAGQQAGKKLEDETLSH